MRTWVGIVLIISGAGFVMIAALGAGRLRAMPFVRTSYVFLGLVLALNGASDMSPAVVGVPWLTAILVTFLCGVGLMIAGYARGEYRRRP